MHAFQVLLWSRPNLLSHLSGKPWFPQPPKAHIHMLAFLCSTSFVPWLLLPCIMKLCTSAVVIAALTFNRDHRTTGTSIFSPNASWLPDSHNINDKMLSELTGNPSARDQSQALIPSLITCILRIISVTVRIYTRFISSSSLYHEL